MVRLSFLTKLVLIVLTLANLPLRGAEKVDTDITKQLRQIVTNEVIPAYWRGSAEDLIRSTTKLLVTADEIQLKAIDEWLADESLPATDVLLAEARFSASIHGASQSLPSPSVNELASTIPYFEEKLEEIQAKGENEGLTCDALPHCEDLTQFRDLLWKMHVYENELANHALVARHAAELVKEAPRKATRNQPIEIQELLRTDFETISRQLLEKREMVHESELELRVQRLDYAVQVLSNESDMKERFLAAYAVSVDGQLLNEIFQARQGAQDRQVKERSNSPQETLPRLGFRRERLNDSALPTHIVGQVEHAEELAGALRLKSRLLFDGLRWWTRGRYGRGPEAFGLLKSPSALQSELNLQAISMPTNSPIPSKPGYGHVPEYTLRHHVIWSLDDSRLTSSVHFGPKEIVDRKVLGVRDTGTDYFY